MSDPRKPEKLLSEDEDPIRSVPDAVRKAWERRAGVDVGTKRKAAEEAVRHHRERQA